MLEDVDDGVESFPQVRNCNTQKPTSLECIFSGIFVTKYLGFQVYLAKTKENFLYSVSLFCSNVVHTSPEVLIDSTGFHFLFL